MDRLFQSDGFGGRQDRLDTGSPLDRPYGPRELGATTDAAEPAQAGWGPVQASGGEAGAPATSGDLHATAARGLTAPATSLPHLSTIQQAFGGHDVSGVQAHVGGPAAAAAGAIGAEAYATGDHVAFREAPSLHTAAHEAAHVVQQRAGIHLKGGVGEEHDVYERHADAVADHVVAGQSAEALLSTPAHAADHGEAEAAEGEGEGEAEADVDGDGGLTFHAAPAARPAVAQRKAATGGAPALQLAPAPAAVTAADGAGLHKSNRKKKHGNQAVTVRTGGVFGTGTKLTIPFATRITIDRAKAVVGPDHVYAEHNGEIGYVKKAHIKSDQIGQSDYFIIGGNAAGRCLIYDRATGQPVDNNPIAAQHAAAFQASIAHVLGAQTPIEDIHGLIKGMIKQAALGVAPDPGLFQLATQNLDQKVAQRVAADKNDLVQANLITQQHDLVAVRFSGADFHKGGQAPFFLEFETQNQQNRDRRRVVYKPGNLGVDRQLFGSQQDSLAKKLDQGGTQISNYTILAKEDQQHEKYGYMEFVHSGTPQDAADVTAMWRSVGANMAASYLAGLEDIHHENVLLLRDRIQVIDMEATTGMFNAHGGFSSALWDTALHRGLKLKLENAARAGTLVSAPTSNQAQTAASQAFKAVLDTAKGQAFDNEWGNQTQALGGMQSRLVPLATASFYNLIARAKNTATLNLWQADVDGDVDGIATQAGAMSGNSLPFVKRVLRSPGTYNALRRGEVPFFKRDLGSRDVFDEEGNRIDATGSSKVGQDITQEMDGRRTNLQQQGDQANAFVQFQAQMVPQIGTVNTAVLTAIQHRQQQNGGGNGGNQG